MEQFKIFLARIEQLLYIIGLVTLAMWLIDDRMGIYLEIVLVIVVYLNAYLGKQFFLNSDSGTYLRHIGYFLDGLMVFVFSGSIMTYYFPEAHYALRIILPCIMLCAWFILSKKNASEN